MILCTAEVSKGDRVWQAFITEGQHNPPASVLALAAMGGGMLRRFLIHHLLADAAGFGAPEGR
jgi:hypothetical protein